MEKLAQLTNRQGGLSAIGGRDFVRRNCLMLTLHLGNADIYWHNFVDCVFFLINCIKTVANSSVLENGQSPCNTGFIHWGT